MPRRCLAIDGTNARARTARERATASRFFMPRMRRSNSPSWQVSWVGPIETGTAGTGAIARASCLLLSLALRPRVSSRQLRSFCQGGLGGLRARPVLHRDVDVVDGGTPLGADLPIGGDQNAEIATTEDGIGEVVTIQGGLGLVEVQADYVRDGRRGAGRVCAEAGMAAPATGLPQSKGTRVLRTFISRRDLSVGRAGTMEVGHELPVLAGPRSKTTSTHISHCNRIL